MNASTVIETTTYEVVWGCDERDRTTRVDYHDASVISEDAERLATLVFIKWQGPVGLFKDGVLIAGTAHTCEQCNPPAVEHLTRTYQRRVGERYITKSNGSCGRFRPEFEMTWVCTCGNGGFGRNNDRADARHLARRHRENPEEFPGRPWPKATFITAKETP